MTQAIAAARTGGTVDRMPPTVPLLVR